MVDVEALRTAFDGRLAEIAAYLDLLERIEEQLRAGPQPTGAAAVTVTPQQQKILYSAVFLHLYNLVESTITGCFDAVTGLAMDGRWIAGDLIEPLRREWVKFAVRTHVDLHPEHRLDAALAFCNRVIASMPVLPFPFQKGAGTWDDARIEEMTQRIGLRVVFS